MEAPAADPEVVIGIWENSHAHDGDILVADNVFTNADPGNDPANNLQRGFRVTTHSSATGTTTYSGNTVRGANRGIEWLSGQNFAGRLPVVMERNDLSDTTEAVRVTSEGSAVFSCNRLDGATDLLNDTTNLLDAEENWWGCNDGPGAPDCGTAPAMATVDPWVILGFTVPTPLVEDFPVPLVATLSGRSGASPATCTLPDGIEIGFTATAGLLASDAAATSGEEASVEFTPPVAGTMVTLTAQLDGQTLEVTRTVLTRDIFADGFESGGLSAWSQVVP